MSLINLAPPSEKSFGLLFALVFVLFGIYSVHKSQQWVAATVFFVFALFFLVAALMAPNVLAPFNKAWYALGLLLAKIVNPMVLGAIFFLLVTPVAVCSRFLGRDQLRLRTRNVNSYWVQREPIGPDAESFKNQF